MTGGGWRDPFMPCLVLPCPRVPPCSCVLMPNGNTKRVSRPTQSDLLLIFFPNFFFGHNPRLLELTYRVSSSNQIKMQLYFLLAAVLPTVILGSPLENFMSFIPQDDDLAPNPDHITYPYSDALQSQNSNDQTFEAFAVADQQQQTGPNFAYDVALAPNSQGEKVDDETASYRAFNCREGYSVCCQGSDLSRSSQHKPCSESKNKFPKILLLLLPLFSTFFAKIYLCPTPSREQKPICGT